MQPIQQNSSQPYQCSIETLPQADTGCARQPTSYRPEYPTRNPFPGWGECSRQNNFDRVFDLLSKLVDHFLKRSEEKKAETSVPPVNQPSTPGTPTPSTGTPTTSAPSTGTPTTGTPATTQPSTPQPGTPTVPGATQPSTPTTPTTPSPVKTPDAGKSCACPVDTKSPAEKPKSPDLKHTDGFLWKPISEKDGKLAILLPPSLTGKVKGLRILSPDGKTTIGRGRASGVANGEREHFRFTKPGSHFPDGCKVEIELKDGTKRLIDIPETSERYTKK